MLVIENKVCSMCGSSIQNNSVTLQGKMVRGEF